MNFYPENINRRFHGPEHAGTLNAANAVGRNASFVCGVQVRLGLSIDPRSKEIQDAKFTANGCGFLIASADALLGKIKGTKLTELHGLDEKELRIFIEEELGKFPSGRLHCLETILETLRSALADFRVFQLKEFSGEKALICTCFGVSEEAVEKIVREKHIASVAELGSVCNAGTGCGSCQPLIREIIETRFDTFN